MTKAKVLAGWSSRTLRSLAQDKQFSIVDGPFGTQLHADEYTTQGVPLVRVGNTSYSGKFLDEDLVYITEAKADKLVRSEVVPNDIIVAKTGATIGKLALFPSRYPRGIIASSCIKISLDTNKADPLYMRYQLASHEGQRKILDGASGSTRLTINCIPFGDISFFIPDDVETQKRISHVLLTVDEVIEKTEASIEKYKALRQAMMHDLFTRGLDKNRKLRPSRKDAPELYQKSPLGWIPKEWDVVSIKKVAHINPEKRKTSESPIDYIDIESVSDFAVRKTSRLSSPNIPSRAQRIVRNGDTVISNVRPNLKAFAHIGKNLDGCICSTGFTVLRPFDISSGYLFAQAQYDQIFLSQLLRKTIGSNYPAVNSSDIAEALIVKPSPSEQTMIEQRLESLAREISISMAFLFKNKMLKQSIMSDLLSGEVPVKA